MPPAEPQDPRRSSHRRYQDPALAAFKADPLLRPHADFAFERKENVGFGGSSAVFRVHDHRFKREAALKLLLDPHKSPNRIARFFREARVTALLDHPAVPPIYEFGRSPRGDHYILMKLVRGHTLTEAINHLHNRPDPLRSRPRSLAELLRHFARVCEAVEYAHAKGVLHRDLKPDNIMIGSHGEVYLMDWGIARDKRESADEDKPFRPDVSAINPSVFEDQLSSENSASGTYTYMAPEQARGEDADTRSEVYSLGAILFQILTGRPPVSIAGVAGAVAVMEGRLDLVSNLPAGIPKALLALTRKALQFERDKRPESPREFLNAVNASGSRRPSPRPRRGLAALSIVLALALIGGLIERLSLAPPEAAPAPTPKPKPLSGPVPDPQLQQRIAELEGTLEASKEARADLKKSRALIVELSRGFFAYSRREPREAFERFSAAIKIDERCAQAYKARADVYLELDDPQSALKDLERALALDDGDGEAHFLMGIALGTLRDYQQAYRAFDAAIKKGFDSPRAYSNRARALSDLGLFSRSIPEFERLIQSEPGNPEHLNRRGEAHAALGDDEQALADFNEAIRQAPDYLPAYVNRAEIALRRGRHQSALSDLNRVVGLDSVYPTALDFRGRALVKLGRPREALASFARAMDIDRRCGLYYLDRAQAHRALGDEAAAAQDLRTALLVEPQVFHMHRRYAAIAEENGDSATAIAQLETAIGLLPQEDERRPILSRKLAALKREQ